MEKAGKTPGSKSIILLAGFSECLNTLADLITNTLKNSPFSSSVP